MTLAPSGKEKKETVRSREFPWGVQIASLVHPTNNDVLPGKLPTAPGGLIISYYAEGERAANDLVEYAVASMLNELPFGLAKVGVLDLGLRKRFHDLSLLPSRLYEVCTTGKEVSDYFAQVEGELIRRYHSVLGGEVKTISDFNRDNPFDEKYTVLAVDLDSVFPDKQKIQVFSKLLPECFDGGIYPILMNNLSLSGEAKTALLEGCRGKFIEVIFDRNGKELQMKIPPHNDHWPALAAVIEKFQLSVHAVKEKAAGLVAEISARERTDGSKDFVTIPIGLSADGRKQVNFCLGARSSCYHAFVMGTTGSGKTSLLNNIIIQIAEQFTSKQIQLYLMDYKEGTEFQIFDTHPNCRKIHLDNKNTAAAESLLVEFGGEIDSRGELYKQMKQDVKDIDQYNALNPENSLPRIILVIDEVQCLLTGKSGSYRFLDLLKDVVKRGRTFGVHIILSTQTLSGYSVDSELMSQIGLRIAYKLSLDSDCSSLLEFGNNAPRNLEKFQIIYNGNYGLKHSNLFAHATYAGDPPAIRERLARVLAERPEHLVLKPVISQKQDPVPDAGPQSAEKVESSAFSNLDAEEEALLEKERKEDEEKERRRKEQSA